MKQILTGAAMLCAFALLAYPGRDQNKIAVWKKGSEVLVRSWFSPEQDIVISLIPGSNGQLTYGGTGLIHAQTPLEKTKISQSVHQTFDDSPVYIANGSYFGGNHAGCYGIAVHTKEPHGLTDSDVGSQWKDGAGTIFHIVKIVNPTRFWVLSENGGTKPNWKFVTKLHPDSFVNTATRKKLEIRGSSLLQLHPGSRILKQEYLVDGKIPLAEDKPVICDSLVARDIHDIIAPDSLLEYIKKNPGRKADFTAPEIESQTTRNFTYTILPGGMNLIHMKTIVRRDQLVIGHDSPIMGQPLNPERYPVYEYYIPDTVPTKGDKEERIYDFNAVQKMDQPIPVMVSFRTPRNVPDRFIQFLGNKNGRKIGFAMGLDPLTGLGKRDEILKNTYLPAYIHRTGKTYTIYHDGRRGGSPAGTVLEYLGYRTYINPERNPDATCVYSYWNGDSGMLYADFHKPVRKVKIALPPKFQGKKFSVVRQYGNTTYEIRKDQILITVPEKQGYLILKAE